MVGINSITIHLFNIHCNNVLTMDDVASETCLLGPVYMKESCPWQEGTLPSRPSHLLPSVYMKKVVPADRVKLIPHNCL